jgi:hypothetical protein
MAKRESTRRIFVLDGLRMPRVWTHGPQWKRSFGVREVPLVDLLAPGEREKFDLESHPKLLRPVLTWSFEEDLRELIQEEIRPGVYAEWSDPFEAMGLQQKGSRRRCRE